MKQEFEIGAEVTVEIRDISGKAFIYPLGKIVGYKESGYFKKLNGLQRYKVELLTGEIIFTGAVNIKKLL